jgi:hypothetical protein
MLTTTLIQLRSTKNVDWELIAFGMRDVEIWRFSVESLGSTLLWSDKLWLHVAHAKPKPGIARLGLGSE